MNLAIILKRISFVVTLAAVSAWTLDVFAYVSVYSNVRGKNITDIWAENYRKRKKISDEWERQSAVDRQVRNAWYNTWAAHDAVRDWPKCRAMKPDGSICRRWCGGKNDIYCVSHMNYVKLGELFFEAVDHVNSVLFCDGSEVIICTFGPIYDNSTQAVYVLDASAQFKVRQVVQLGRRFVVTDSNDREVIVDCKENLYDGCRLPDGRYVYDGIKQYGVQGAMRTIPSLRRLGERELRTLKAKQEREQELHNKQKSIALQKAFDEVQGKLHESVDALVGQGKDDGRREIVGKTLHEAVLNCYGAFIRCSADDMMSTTVALRKAWDDEVECQKKARVSAFETAKNEGEDSQSTKNAGDVERQAFANTTNGIERLTRDIWRWAFEYDQRVLPQSLSQLAFLRFGRKYVDGWGRELLYKVENGVAIIRSCGSDGVRGTSDDIVFYVSVADDGMKIYSHDDLLKSDNVSDSSTVDHGGADDATNRSERIESQFRKLGRPINAK